MKKILTRENEKQGKTRKSQFLTIVKARGHSHTLFLPHNFLTSVEAFAKHVTSSSRYSQILACYDVITDKEHRAEPREKLNKETGL